MDVQGNHEPILADRLTATQPNGMLATESGCMFEKMNFPTPCSAFVDVRKVRRRIVKANLFDSPSDLDAGFLKMLSQKRLTLVNRTMSR